MRKTFPVFDCDAHVNDPLEIWDYVEPEHRDLVRHSYVRDDQGGLLNGKTRVFAGEGRMFLPSYNPICIAGPGMSKALIRKLLMSPLDDEKRDYLEHKGAYDPRARIKEMDLMGIDQVMVIPTMMVQNFPFVENAEGAYALARAYNNWAADFCKAVPDRLFAAGWLPVQNIDYAVREMTRIKKMDVRVALLRPIDAQGNYPSQINPSFGGVNWDPVYRAFEETGLVLGMHTFPSSGGPGDDPDAARMYSPGQLIDASGHGEGLAQGLNSQTLSFIYEATVWLTQVLMSGFLDRYPKLTMAIFESNATWLPGVLERLDRYFTLYGNERRVPAQRLPSEAFYDQCFISFESDEVPVFRRWDQFENVGLWASDAYHHDGADSWSAMADMSKV
ncbi:MAG: amidohydrolase family protein, partial [Dehalococcoidia bacterium]